MEIHASLSLKTIYTQSSGLFSGFLLLTILISRSSAAMCSPLSGVPIGNLLLTDFHSMTNWPIVLCRSLPLLKGAESS
ncbi:hypothetical protein RO3G_03938 [Rhizopus delemar RA 99-880]|uniref:Uncharacterized protein n=1 Tax=Rhizopus delemar (strain RA 99-880 / ATCC MYA-4621 / FGSC 9543 / NRRL 43880) TaxID=246409 RepID=I1BSQ3_RHIO9|nr:hypothetical protein RO3G_03938 [Rhizopus delemar RA 99-880]|eukprot:EIE79233.1 hypothetical protein RO3G_03938 [Rhizopus delemar RA 99-880]